VQFQVPQFIEVEDKVVGPFTFKQFVFILGAAGGSFFLYRLIPSPLSYLFIAPVAGLGLALAFYKVNERPFTVILESWVKFNLGSKRYLWKKQTVQKNKEADELENVINRVTEIKPVTPKLTAGRLKDIAWSLDIKEKLK
jgi:hypothetical protein